MTSGYVVMQTDFGKVSGSSMGGICKLVDGDLRIFDVTYIIPSFDLKAASANLADVLPYWPAGTVFVSVVDPGVGTPRKASVAMTENGYYIVTPDNGALTDVKKKFGIRGIREIDQSVNRYTGNVRSQKSDIFHGRDVFAYCAAKLASKKISFEGVGPAYPVSEIITLE
ncbi:MAG: SAM-dependent chlorinase/fluorinase [Oscillospiraceae bacterium]|nr:SAM-dependent chlorinase/fluorinase [Oscillospiraceae bacterium]